ncbi:pyrroloquinoline quinone biosynthesis peptide chaperone PqqD [Streptomyces mauvecolor]|uniref:Pyrroloquinoline quinone biosynthesis peptide chaperone PqqD n=1 Tax=Streptomyces mauvecolor TaxID=58345 RepID=A0ABV9UZ98_9ACTN
MTVTRTPGSHPQAASAPTPDPAWRPALARHVLLRHDRVRGADLLVLPERVVVLHGPAGGIVRLCDGERDVRGIVEELAARHPEAPVAAEVPLFLGRLREEGWLR